MGSFQKRLRVKVWAESTLASKNWNFKRLNYCMIIANIFLLGRNLGAIRMDLLCQLFPQSTVVLLPPCKQDEAKGRGKAHVKRGSHKLDVSLLFSPCPLPQGKFSLLVAQPWMSSLLIWLISWIHTVYLDPWYSALLPKEASNCLSLQEHRILWAPNRIPTSLSLQGHNRGGKVGHPYW